MPYRPMTAEQVRARHARLPDLEATVAAGARCASEDAPGPYDAEVGDWFREDGEPLSIWAVRRVALLDYCKSCPVLTECREIGLRRDAATADGDMVRGGKTGDQLAAMRRSSAHRKSLDDAIAADDAHDPDAERREINRLAIKLQQLALVLNDDRPQRRDRTRRQPNSDDRAREASATLRSLRTQRRTRTGWSTAA